MIEKTGARRNSCAPNTVYIKLTEYKHIRESVQ